ncbi:hypothetical protein DSM112329_02893 [Paraconexibacter sp. AEG42_29]|uniref:Calcium-binding protein n=1 Tax=Paraconexibacter sp. AEG42_29 TaxID=2997339 RepID=A0AAU7AWJ5_9ACTN
MVVYAAAPGEANRVTVAAAKTGGTWLFQDDGAPVIPGTGCVTIDEHTAGCTAANAQAMAVSVFAGDGDDSVRVPDDVPAYQVEGGDGNDFLQGAGWLSGGSSDDTLIGSSQSDRLRGGPGRDVLRGGAGNDTLSGDGTETAGDAGGSDDVLEGGAGVDLATYESRTAPIAADLAAGTAGTAGERDQLDGVEAVTGGSGADSFAGDDGPNTLSGGAGDDMLVGRGGGDTLYDGTGADRIDGGNGADQLTANDPGDVLAGGLGSDRLTVNGPAAVVAGGDGDDTLVLAVAPTAFNCGAGNDTVAGPGTADRRVDGCEQFAVLASDLFSMATAPHRTANGALTVAVYCRPQTQAVIATCRGTVTATLRRPGRTPLKLGQAKIGMSRGHRATLAIRPRAAIRRALRTAGAHPLVAVDLSGYGALKAGAKAGLGGAGVRPPFSGSWQIRL